MSEPQRLLARMNTISVDWQNSVPTTGKVLRAEDIAGSLAGLARSSSQFEWRIDHEGNKE